MAATIPTPEEKRKRSEIASYNNCPRMLTFPTTPVRLFEPVPNCGDFIKTEEALFLVFLKLLDLPQRKSGKILASPKRSGSVCQLMLTVINLWKSIY